jgi:hypothetical protein
MKGINKPKLGKRSKEIRGIAKPSEKVLRPAKEKVHNLYEDSYDRALHYQILGKI